MLFEIALIGIVLGLVFFVIGLFQGAYRFFVNREKRFEDSLKSKASCDSSYLHYNSIETNNSGYIVLEVEECSFEELEQIERRLKRMGRNPNKQKNKIRNIQRKIQLRK